MPFLTAPPPVAKTIGTVIVACLATIAEMLSPTITATGPFTTFCVPLPSPFHFFRVVEGLALNPYVPPPVLSITRTNNGILLTWTGPFDARYQVQWNSVVIPPPPWNTFTNIITSTNLNYQFFDDGTQTGLGQIAIHIHGLTEIGAHLAHTESQQDKCGQTEGDQSDHRGQHGPGPWRCCRHGDEP